MSRKRLLALSAHGLPAIDRFLGAGYSFFEIVEMCISFYHSLDTAVLCRFKGRLQFFSMQVAMNKCFLRNPEKK